MTKIQLFFALLLAFATACDDDNKDLNFPFPVTIPTDSIGNGDVSIQLHDLEMNNDDHVVLTWESEAANFLSFEIIRYSTIDNYNPSHQIIGTVPADVFTFTDTEPLRLPGISYAIMGRVGIPGTDYYTNSVASNEVVLPDYINFIRFKTTDVVPLLEYDRLLLINRDEGLLRDYNYKTHTFSDKNLGASLGICSVHKSGTEHLLLIPRNDGWLDLYSLPEMTLKDQIKISVYELFSALISDNLIYCNTSSYREPIVVHNRDAGTNTVIGHWYDDTFLHLMAIPGTQTEMFGINSNMVFYSFDQQGNLINRTYKYISDEGANVSDRFTLIPGTRKIISAPLGNIYDSSIQYVSGLPRGNLFFSDIYVNDAASHIFAACSNKNAIEVYDANTLRNKDSLPTEGYPFRIFYTDGGFVALTSITPFQSDHYYYYDYPFILTVEEIPYTMP